MEANSAPLRFKPPPRAGLESDPPKPKGCPSRLRRAQAAQGETSQTTIALADLHREPFRIFFPAATLAGLIGVLLWPMMILGWTGHYPGPSHARLMIHGFFGGFILGFMGTAMPKLVGARPFTAIEAGALLSLFVANVVANTLHMNQLGDCLFVIELAGLFALLRKRCHSGGDSPPASFVLVALGFGSAVAGILLQFAVRRWELDMPLEILSRLLAWHGFILLAIMGAGAFLLPRFLGALKKGLNEEDPGDSAVRTRKTRRMLAIGAAVLATFPLEAYGWTLSAGLARGIIVTAFIAAHLDWGRLRWSWTGVQWHLLTGLACIPIGFIAAGWLSGIRVGLLHTVLAGGFALITMGVATRVVFGHSGGRDRLERVHWGLTVAGVLMLLGLLSRISGDFLPRIQMSHYLYGALTWAAGLVVWAICVLPRVTKPDR